VAQHDRAGRVIEVTDELDGAVALDLLDSADPRHWIAAEELVANA